MKSRLLGSVCASLFYKQAMDVAVHFEKIVAGFSRYHKYTLGTELRNKSREVVALIMK